MRISELLLAKKLVSVEDIDKALERQGAKGGPLADSLLALDLISIVDLDTALRDAPPAPTSPGETGLSDNALLKMLTKTIFALQLERVGELRAALRLPTPIITELLKECVNQKLVEEYVAETNVTGNETGYRLSGFGKSFAEEALDQNRYVGPAPVTLEVYVEQIHKQAIAKEFVTPEKVEKAFSDLVISEGFVRRLGPALNSGKSMLLYGPPGNGKSTVAEKIGAIYENVIFVPYAIDVGGEIITIYDRAVHIEVDTTNAPSSAAADLRREEIDQRWVPCHRPLVITGGELTLEMLDLSFNKIAKFYEAPLHMKAQGGVFIVDDFGRQLVRPEELLNRWIVPLERRTDFLKLHTGRQFEIPFDQLTIFSTNLQPDDLMDPAFLRRIPYKIEVVGPSEDEFGEIFKLVCKAKNVPCTDDEVVSTVKILKESEGFKELACYQGIFIIDQVLAACRYKSQDVKLDEPIIADAVANMFARSDKDAVVAR